MLKYKILNNITDSFIELPINLDFDPMDNSELIEEFIREEKRKALNKQKDFEVIRYSPELSTSITIDSFGVSIVFNIGDRFIPKIQVFFYDCDNNIFVNNYNGTGFNTDNSIQDDRLKKEFSKSFYVLDFFDSIDSREQNKLFSIILPVVSPSNPVDKKTIIPDFLINKDTEGYYIYYLKNTELPIDIFMKLTFFNGKTGKRVSFFNNKITNIVIFDLTTLPNPEEYKDEMLYFRYRLNDNFTYDIIDSDSSVILNPVELIKKIIAIEVRFKV